MTTTSRNGAEILVAALQEHGVDTVWGIPGTHNLAIYEALAASRIRHLLPRHEQGAAFAADGYARSSGRVGVCVTTSGPAVLNAATAMAQAYSDSVPVLLVSAGMPLRHPGRGNGNLHETKDLTAAMNAIVEYSHRVTSAEEIPVAVAQAFTTMSTGRPRPVHLEIPYDVLEEGAEPLLVAPVRPPRVVPAPESVAAAGALLDAAERPVLVVGGGARGAAAEVRTLAEHLWAPVVCSINGKGTLADEHPLALGAGLQRPSVADLVRDSDLVLVVGCELAPADLWDGPLELDGKVLRIDIDSAQVPLNGIPAATVVADAAEGLTALAADSHPPVTRVLQARERWVRDWRRRFFAEAAELARPWKHVLDPIAESLGEDGIVAGDSAKICYLGAVPGLPAHGPSQFLYPTGYGTLGYALPAAIGAKTAFPDRRVLCLVGDGGVMFSIAELASAAQLRIGLPVIVADNGGFGEIRDEMVHRGQETLGVDIPSPDFVGLARAMGCHAHTVDGSADLRVRLEEAFDADLPTVLHVRTV